MVDVAAMGVDEIDIVIDRSLVLNEDWKTLFKEISEMKKACGEIKLKTILSTGDLPSLSHVHHATIIAIEAGSDFIKTSTGKEAVNATLPVGIVMSQAIKEYESKTGRKVHEIFLFFAYYWRKKKIWLLNFSFVGWIQSCWWNKKCESSSRMDGFDRTTIGKRIFAG